jgi:hypothetical protein
VKHRAITGHSNRSALWLSQSRMMPLPVSTVSQSRASNLSPPLVGEYDWSMAEVTVSCGICPSDIRLGDVNCPGCGRQVDDRDRAVLQVRLESWNFVAHDRAKVMRSASSWIAALAIIFAISAGFAFFMSKQEVDQALSRLEDFDDSQVLQPIDGKTYTAGQLREKVAREPVQVLVINLVVAGLMGALWAWARRSPLPAICGAFALLVVVYGGSAVLDPSSILKGIILKIASFAALYKGLRAALAARVAMKRLPT